MTESKYRGIVAILIFAIFIAPMLTTNPAAGLSEVSTRGDDQPNADVTVGLSIQARAHESDRDSKAPNDVSNRPSRQNSTSFAIVFDKPSREVHIHGFDGRFTMGTAIIVANESSLIGSDILRINLVSKDPEYGDLYLNKDIPLESAGFSMGGQAEPSDSAVLVEEIYYHGSDAQDQFSNYTSVPLWARGYDGDDFFLGGHGSDDLSGGDGDDKIRGGAGPDVVSGGNGDDLLYGDEGDDELFGSKGQDVIDGGSGDDMIKPGQGSDRSYGRDGDDSIIEQSANALMLDVNLLCGHDGADHLKGGSGAETINELDGELGGGVGDGHVDTLIGHGMGYASADFYEWDDLDPVQNLYFNGSNEILIGEGSLLAPEMIMCG